MTGPAFPEPPHLLTDLKELKLPTFAAQWARWAGEARKKRLPYGEYLADLAHREVQERREKRIKRRIQEAKFPVLKTLDAFDFGAQPRLDRDRVLALFTCDFIEERSNVVFLGEVGTGKTHLAIALGITCCQKDYRVRFTTVSELVNVLLEAKREGRLHRKVEQLARYDVIFLDELGYVPFDKRGANLLFGLISKVYERKSLVVTTNLPFARWSEVFLDATTTAAVIDRIVHHSRILQTQGESYRLHSAKKESRRRTGSGRRKSTS